jgi:lysozyme family protein
MPALEDALALIKEHEGGLTEVPEDPGGITNYGISLRFLRTLDPDLGDVDGDGDLDADDIKGMTWERAAHIFQVEFWDRYHYEVLPDALAIKLFDLAVNMGPSQAHRLLQRSLRACKEQVEEDGVIGKDTRAAVARVQQTGAIMASLRSECAGFYRVLVAQKPSMSVFLEGWLSRAYS